MKLLPCNDIISRARISWQSTEKNLWENFSSPRSLFSWKAVRVFKRLCWFHFPPDVKRAHKMYSNDFHDNEAILSFSRSLSAMLEGCSKCPEYTSERPFLLSNNWYWTPIALFLLKNPLSYSEKEIFAPGYKFHDLDELPARPFQWEWKLQAQKSFYVVEIYERKFYVFTNREALCAWNLKGKCWDKLDDSVGASKESPFVF